MVHWFYGENGQQSGPVDDAGIRQLIALGRVTPGTLVWREGMPSWLPMAHVPELGNQVAPAYPHYLNPPNSGLAIASMVCGLVGPMFCYFAILVGIPAVICGHMALNRIANSPVPVAGRGMALTGLILGYLWIFITVAGILSIAFFAATAKP